MVVFESLAASFSRFQVFVPFFFFSFSLFNQSLIFKVGGIFTCYGHSRSHMCMVSIIRTFGRHGAAS